MADGSYKNIQDVTVGDKILCLDDSDNKIRVRQVTNTFVLPAKKPLKIKTRRGLVLQCADTHKLMTEFGWEEAKYLEIGDFLASIRITIFGNKTYDKSKLKILAYMIGDGRIGDRSEPLDFTAYNEKIHDDFCISARSVGAATSLDKQNPNIINIISLSTAKFSNPVREMFNDLGLLGKGSPKKFIPSFVFELDRDHLSLFLSRLYSTDGWAYLANEGKVRGEIGYCTTSEPLAFQLIELLSKYGICARKYTKQGSYEGKKCLPAYTVIIKDKDHIRIFLENIGIFGKEASCKIVEEFVLTSSETGGVDCVPKSIVLENLNGTQKIKGQSALWRRLVRPDYRSVRRDTLQRASFVFEMLNCIANNHIYWDEISEIEYSTDVETMYDFEVEEFHNYIANGIVSHNCVVMAEKPTREIMLKVGEAVNYFNGRYITAEDVGTKLPDILTVAEVSPYTIKTDGSENTALGVFSCLQSALIYHGEWGSSLNGIPVWVEGLGKVGFDLAKRLLNAGANVYVNDLRPDVVKEAIALGAHEITESEKRFVYIYSPCAMGQVVNDTTRYPIICGSANNQLEDDTYAETLKNNEIMYCPDYLVNAGGVITAAYEINAQQNANSTVEDACIDINRMLISVLEMSKASNTTPLAMANMLAESRLTVT